MKEGYKQTEIGVIPEDWEVSSLDCEYSLYAGGDLDDSDYSPVKTQEYRFPIYSNGMQQNGIYGFCACPQFSENAVTITGRGDIGHSSFRDEPFSAIIRLLVCQPKHPISSRFIAEYLEMTKPFVFESTGVPQLTVPQIKNTPLPIPPLAEQNRIAEALSDMDELIASLEKLIAKKKAIKQGAMQELLTGKRRLPGFTGEWEMRAISSLGKFVSGNGFPLEFQGHQVGKYPFYKVSDFNNIGNEQYLKRANNYISPRIAEKLKCNIIPMDSIVFAKIGAAIFLERKKLTTVECCIDNITMSFQANDCVSPHFLWYVFQTIRFGDLVEATALPSLSGKSIGGISKLFPPTREEQEAIASVLLDIDHAIADTSQRLDKVRQIKNGMMQQLLTGKIRIIERKET